jgi:hypothetical protein
MKNPVRNRTHRALRPGRALTDSGRLLVLAVLLALLGACANPVNSDGTGGGGGGGDAADPEANDPSFDGILVTSSADGGPGSLRQAVTDAQSGDEIRFASDMTIQLTGDRRGIEIDKDITINGTGRTVVIEGSGEQRHFTHMPGGPYTLTIANLTLRNGEPRMTDLLPGGSLYVAGGSTVTIENVTFTDNLGTNGGVVFVEYPGPTTTLNIVGSTFTDNEARGSSNSGGAAGSGGAVYVFDTNLTVTDSVFEDNFTIQGNPQQPDPISGGAVAINGGAKSVITDSTFRSNRAGLYGGAITARNSSLDVVGSLFEDNRGGVNGTQYLISAATGGAIHTLSQTGAHVLLIGRSRFLRNRAEGPDNSGSNRIFRGGAVSTWGHPVAVFSSEFFGNYVGDTGANGQSASIAANSGSAIYHVATGSTQGLVITSSAFVGNVASGADYGTETAQGSAVASESESILYDISFSTFAQNVGTPEHQHFWFAGEELHLTNSTFRFVDMDVNELTLPDPQSSSNPLVQNVVAADGLAGWPGNTPEPPVFVRAPSPGPDATWGTADDDYGDLRPAGSSFEYLSPLTDSGDVTYLPADWMDLDGDGNTTEPLPVDAAGRPRANGTIDIGAYEG